MACDLLLVRALKSGSAFWAIQKTKIERKNLMTKILQLIVLTLVLAGAAFAQFLPAGTGRGAFSFSGSETTGDSFGMAAGSFGNTFALNGANDDYSSVLLTTAFTFDGPEDPVNGNSIVGGTWNAAIYRKGVYIGSIYGDVTTGNVMWTSSENKNIYAEFSVTGGNGDFAGFSSDSLPVYEGDTDVNNGDTRAVLKEFRF